MPGKSGTLYDATAFPFDEKNMAIDHFERLFQAGGYNYYGTECVYSGIDGREMSADIFLGVVHYQRLMVHHFYCKIFYYIVPNFFLQIYIYFRKIMQNSVCSQNIKSKRFVSSNMQKKLIGLFLVLIHSSFVFKFIRKCPMNSLLAGCFPSNQNKYD